MNDTLPAKSLIDTVAENIIGWTLTVFAFLLPVFFLPTTANFYDPNKFLLLIAATVICVVTWSVQTIMNKNARFTSTPFTLPVILLGLVYLVSTFTSGTNPVESLMGRGLLFPLLALLFITATSVVADRKSVNRILYAA